jgi:threonine synthase
MIALATAHPAKFGAAVKAAIGAEPPMPPRLADVLNKPERVTTLDNDVRAIGAFISARARAHMEKA